MDNVKAMQGMLYSFMAGVKEQFNSPKCPLSDEELKDKFSVVKALYANAENSVSVSEIAKKAYTMISENPNESMIKAAGIFLFTMYLFGFGYTSIVLTPIILYFLEYHNQSDLLTNEKLRMQLALDLRHLTQNGAYNTDYNISELGQRISSIIHLPTFESIENEKRSPMNIFSNIEEVGKNIISIFEKENAGQTLALRTGAVALTTFMIFGIISMLYLTPLALGAHYIRSGLIESKRNNRINELSNMITTFNTHVMQQGDINLVAGASLLAQSIVTERVG